MPEASSRARIANHPCNATRPATGLVRTFCSAAAPDGPYHHARTIAGGAALAVIEATRAPASEFTVLVQQRINVQRHPFKGAISDAYKVLEGESVAGPMRGPLAYLATYFGPF